MKRGAIWAALAAIVLLAVVCIQRWSVGSCDFEQKIITPDGQELVLQGPRLSVGSPDSDWPLEGEGLPPVEHLSQEIYGMPGALYKGTIVKPRVLTITATENGLTYRALMDMKARMQGALRWDRGEPGDPSIYRITMNGVSRDLCVYYDSAVERRIGRPGRVVVVAIRLITYDPFWYSTQTEEQVLDWSDEATVLYYAERVDGLWLNSITQPAAVAGVPVVRAFAVHPDTGDVYIGGTFLDWDNNLLSDYLVRWVAATDTWQNVGDNGAGGAALNGIVRALQFGPDGYTLYVGGEFTDAGGVLTADYAAQVDVRTDTWADIGGGPGGGAVVTAIHSIVVGYDGTVYLAGNFTNWQGDAYITSWTGAAWVTLGVVNNIVYDMLIMPSGNLMAVGSATSWGGVAANRIAEWNGTVWSAVGTGTSGPVLSIAIGPDGMIYIGGAFAAAGGNTVNQIAKWNGVAFSDLDGGVNNTVARVATDSAGNVYAGGAFTQAGSATLADRVARWNGFSWTRLDIDMPGAGQIAGLEVYGTDLYIGGQNTGIAYFAGANTVINAGNAFALPIIEIKNQGLLQSIRNETMDYDIPCDMQIQDGEIVTIDLSSGVKSAESNWRGNRLGDILPAGDMATFCLESAPRAAYGGTEGANLITVFITGADPRESGDNNNQLSGWANITGISQENTEWGRLYADIVADGGGFYHVDLYMDTAKGAGDLVGHTLSYNGAGAKPIASDNASGLGGTITVDAVVGADTDIQVWFTIVTMFWRDRWWDLDSAVS